MTTTTAAAGAVMDHLEFARDCLWPGLDLAFTSVSDQWAQFSVAGPRALTLMAELTGRALSDDVLPHLGLAAMEVLGVPARVFRLSFSGERAYEIAVPARYGLALMEELVRRAEALGGGVYGLEALNVLRLEKGYLTHAEIDGRVGPSDLGLGKMMASGKDFIGKVMAARPAMAEAGRPRLIGLKPVEAGAELKAGAHLIEEGAEPRADRDLGWISSAGYSPTLGHFIALAFLAGGRDRIGSRVVSADPLRGRMTPCEVVDPVFYDPGGERLHG
jgi:sarcosine oxidase subunit alpha